MLGEKGIKLFLQGDVNELKSHGSEMLKITELETSRLILRQWIASDYLSFSKLNADPDVMRHYVNTLSESESNIFVKKIEDLIAKRGWGFWAIALKADGNFIGFVGLHEPGIELPFSPCVEIGWRLSKKYWGHGYATEAAKTVLKFALETLELDEVVAYSALSNTKSLSVMKKINMIKLR